MKYAVELMYYVIQVFIIYVLYVEHRKDKETNARH